VVICDKFKNFGKIIENSYGSINYNRGNFSFFETRDNIFLLPQVGKSILRQAKIKINLRTGIKFQSRLL
jgi:hypothetical protein